MKIGVISDTHGCMETWEKVFRKFFGDCDMILHAGDVLYHGPRNAIPAEYNPAMLAEVLNQLPIPLVVAAGNCDSQVDGMVLKMPVQAPYAYVVWEGMKILVVHGHEQSDEEKYEMARRMRVDLLIYGHTHIGGVQRRDGITFLNPGSPCMTKREDKRKTVACIDDDYIRVFDVDTEEIIDEIKRI